MRIQSLLIAWMIVTVVSLGCNEKKVQPLKEPAQPATAKMAPTPTEKKTVAPTPDPKLAKEVAPVQPANDHSPIRVIEKYTEELREMVGLKERQQKGHRDEAKEQQVQTKVREFFDFPTLARLSLGENWKRVSPAEQQQFSQLFIKLVEDSYIRRSRDLVGNYDITFTGEEVSGGRSKVTCRVARQDADIDILYELHRKNERWMIFNISLDDVDLIRNYQSQFNQIIQKRGWNELIKLMQKKVDDGQDEDVSI